MPICFAVTPNTSSSREIGAGGMGVVYQAVHRVMNRMVALKVIAPRWLLNPDVKTRFQREVQIAAKLQHRHVVTAFDADEVQGHLFLVSEYVDGESVDQLVERKSVAVSQACRVVVQAAAGLEHAHRHGLIHRDVKPQNLLVSSDGVVKVVDFGLASYIEPTLPDQHGLTSAGVIVGTPDYLSPEQAREAQVDHRADIYSLGCTLYHLLAGKPPFVGGSRVEKLSQHLQATPPDLCQCRADVPAPLGACVAKMMAKDPAQRFQSAREVIDALKPFCDPRKSHRTEIATPQPAPVKAVAPIPKTISRRGWLLAGGAGTVAATGLAYLAWRTDLIAPTTKSREEVQLLVIAPRFPLPRDLNNLRQGCSTLGINDQVTTASAGTDVAGGRAVVLSRVDPNQFDALILLGSDSSGPTELTSDRRVHAQVRRIVEAMQRDRKPITSLGSGVWTLTQLGLARGKRIADCSHTPTEFKQQSGATWLSGEELVVDDRLITATSQTDAVPLLRTILREVTGENI